MAVPPVYVVRHGCAGHKGEWAGPDLDRPLDVVGTAQAVALADELAAVSIQRILTSPARRCRQTVEPLARQLDLPLEAVDELLPTDDASPLSRLVRTAKAPASAVCTHGEQMGSLLSDLRRAGTTITANRDDNDWLLQKGTAWALTVEPGGAIVALDHIAPQPFRRCPAHDPPHRA